MLIRINSTNPDFYSILQKNPNSFGGIQLKKIKNGTGIGFLNNGEYHLLFQDTKYSFAEDLSCQIDYQSFCNPKVLLSLFSEFLRHFLVIKDQFYQKKIPWLNKEISAIDVSGYNHVLEIENIYADSVSMKHGFIFEKYFPEVKLTHKSGNLFSLKIETNDSLYRLINLATLCCMYLAATNRQPWYMSSDLLQKYIRVMKNLHPVPYFIIYLFAKRCIRDERDFKLLKKEMESAFNGNLDLVWGTSQQMRLWKIEEYLSEADCTIPYQVFEVGCGEMDYPRELLGRMRPGTSWHSTDLEDFSYLVPTINKKYPNNYLQFHLGSFDKDILKNDRRALIMVEVIEHMPLLEAEALIINNLKDLEPEIAIITTPNRNFNKNFSLANDFRHEDHHFELTPFEFRAFILKLLPSTYTAEYFGIGDRVDNEYLSQGFLLRRK